MCAHRSDFVIGLNSPGYRWLPPASILTSWPQHKRGLHVFLDVSYHVHSATGVIEDLYHAYVQTYEGLSSSGAFESLARIQAAFPDHHAMWDSDQFHIRGQFLLPGLAGGPVMLPCRKHNTIGRRNPDSR